MAVQPPQQMSQLSDCQAAVPGVQAMTALSLETNDPPAWIPASCCHSRAAPPPSPPALGPDSSAVLPTLPETPPHSGGDQSLDGAWRKQTGHNGFLAKIDRDTVSLTLCLWLPWPPRAAGVPLPLSYTFFISFLLPQFPGSSLGQAPRGCCDTGP